MTEEEYHCLICDYPVEPMDIPLCKTHADWFNLEKLWKMHDNNEIDALDFEYMNVMARFVKPQYFENFVVWIVSKIEQNDERLERLRQLRTLSEKAKDKNNLTELGKGYLEGLQESITIMEEGHL